MCSRIPNFEFSVDLKDEYGRDATNPVEEARERLIDLELNIERRYLKAPLGSNAHINLNTITARITKNSARAKEYEKEQEKLNAVSREISNCSLDPIPTNRRVPNFVLRIFTNCF